MRFSRGLEDSGVDQIFPTNVENSNTAYVFVAAEVILFLLLFLKNHFCSHQVNNNKKKFIERFYSVFCFLSQCIISPVGLFECQNNKQFPCVVERIDLAPERIDLVPERIDFKHVCHRVF